jgi:hypothetical protein
MSYEPTITPQIIFDFNTKSILENWKTIDDVVMGGMSSSTFNLDNKGYGVFKGEISLDNNGGFSSVRYTTSKIDLREFTKIVLKVKGDGNNYQFRIKTNSNDQHSFIAPFSTSGDWQNIEFYLKDLYPSFRGRKLEQSNFDDDYFEAISLLIGNKRKEIFKLLIDKIELC